MQKVFGSSSLVHDYGSVHHFRGVDPGIFVIRSVVAGERMLQIDRFPKTSAGGQE
jgi:hypothetical protein